MTAQTQLPPPVTTIPTPPAAQQVSAEQAHQAVQWLADLALRQLPRTIDGDKDWGSTKPVWSGLKMRFDGLELKTKRRFHQQEHGRWVQYQVTLPAAGDPQAATIQIQSVTPQFDDPSGVPQWQIHSTIVAPMQFTARIQRWNLGVKLYSMTVSGELRIRLHSITQVGLYSDYTEVPPALVIQPHVEQAHLQLERFEVNRISHVGGDVAEHWGDFLQEILVERLVRKQNDKLVEKLNRSLDKHRDDLRISWTAWLQLKNFPASGSLLAERREPPGASPEGLRPTATSENAEVSSAESIER